MWLFLMSECVPMHIRGWRALQTAAPSSTNGRRQFMPCLPWQINTSNDNYTTLTCSYHCCISLSMWSIWRIQDARCSSHCKYFVHQVSKKGNKSKAKFNKYQCHYKIKQIQKIKQILTDTLLTTFASSASVTVVNSISA